MADIKYTKKAIQDRLQGKVVDIWHQESWSYKQGCFYVEHSIEDGNYIVGVGRGVGVSSNQHPLEFKSIKKLEEFVKFISSAVLDSVVIPIPTERRRKRVYLRR